MLDPQIVEAAGDLHDGITDAIGTEPQIRLKNRAALDGADDVLHKHAPSANLPVGGLLVVGQGLFVGFLVQHDHGHIRKHKPEIAEILEQFTARRQGIGRRIGNRRLMGTAFVGIAQQPDPRRPVGQEHVLHRVVVHLAAPVVLLFTCVLGARDGSLGAVVKKGDAAVVAASGSPMRARSSSTVRLGDSPSARRAVRKTGIRMFNQVRTLDWIRPNVAP